MPAIERSQFHALIRGKAVAVVGRARSLIGQGHGRAIDAADVVVRVNRSETFDPEHTGTRTDVIYHALPDPPPEPVACWTIYSDRSIRRQFSTRKHRPTTGVICLYDCLREAATVNAYGFDLYRSPYLDGRPHNYRDGSVKLAVGPRYHFIDRDRQQLRDLLSDPRFRPDPVLRRALCA